MIDPAILEAIGRAGLDPAGVARVVVAALEEDLGSGPDVTTSATIGEAQQGRADAVCRQHGVVAGLPVAALAFALASEGRITVSLVAADGDVVEPGSVLLSARGPLQDVLTAERTALNLLTHLSGVATLTHRWVTAVDAAGARARVRDTRKTMPGLRALEKYAVRCGGGLNHRMSLSDAALIKDNHVAAAGSVRRAFELVRAAAPDLPIEVEVDTPEQCAEAIEAGARMILLDNMVPADLLRCVRLAAAAGSGVRLEASGGLTLESAAAVAATGVDFLSVGALTHSAPVLDIGLDLKDGL
jgi:nicotinate-nucleotide pyrophosphorylase (carboxylating)